VTLAIDIPGREVLLQELVLDVNGTLTDRGTLLEGVADRLDAVGARLDVHLVSADTFGTASSLAASLGVTLQRVESGDEKRRFVEELGGERCVAIGNGANDTAMLEIAALGIAIVGPEGAASAAVRAADVVCGSILDALDLLLDERALVATLRP
jgi:P-type E1-E2 ATPase